MKKFINLLTRRLTLGSLFTTIASFLFAIALRKLFLYEFDILPVKGEIQAIDISFLGIIILFRLICNVFMEYLLNDKFATPLIQVGGYKDSTALSMENTSNSNHSGKGSSKDSEGGSPPKASSKGPLTDEQYSKVRQMINNKADQNPSFKQELEESRQFIDQMFAHTDKMEAVLNEQTSKILKLYSIASGNDVKFIQENGGLDLSIPSNMSDEVAEKLSREVGALDRSLNNKFSEYENLSRKDIRLYDSQGTTVYEGVFSNNKQMYKDLFQSANEKKKKNRYTEIGRQVPLRTESFYNCGSSNLLLC
jgi:hypothetical protein